jgi:hypothetical protein
MFFASRQKFINPSYGKLEVKIVENQFKETTIVCALLFLHLPALERRVVDVDQFHVT